MTCMKKLVFLFLALSIVVPKAGAVDDAATRQLVAQARYWQQNGRDELASDAWKKLLRADANHPEGLVRLGLLEARAGHVAQAQDLYRRATQLASVPAGLAELETVLKAGKNAPTLNIARSQAQSGQAEAATSTYRSALGTSKPTGSLGLEYYQTLGGTREGWEEARRGLTELARSNPGNQRYLLALARHLTYRESSRREGIRQLATMRQPEQAEEVRKSWSQALVWLNARRSDRALFTGYLDRFSDDQAVRERLALLERASVESRKGGRAGPSQAGFKLLERGDLDGAAARFESILAKKPRDADALGGLGTVRLRQQAFSEAVRLLDQAMLRDRLHPERWKQARDSAYYWTLMQQVLAMRQAGKLLDSEDKLIEANKLDERQILGLVLMGDLRLEKRQLAEAQAMYRLALKTSANDPGAFRGLVTVLLQTGREEEASAMISSLDQATALKMDGLGPLKVSVMLKLAEADERRADYPAAIARLEAALLIEPNNPWARLALARHYQRQGDLNRADALLDTLLVTHPTLVEVLHARALLYAEQKRWLDGLTTMERIPVAARSKNMVEDLQRIHVNLQVQRARQSFAQGDRQAAQAAALQAESQAGSDVSLMEQVAGCWIDLGKPAEALRLMRELVRRSPAENADLRIRYAGVLLDNRQDDELAPVLRSLRESPRLTSAQQENLNKIILAYTLRQVDALRDTGRIEEALRMIGPAMERFDEPRLIMALARIQFSGGDARQALTTAERAIAREPNDLEHRLFASGVALAARDIESAARHASVALELGPNDTRVLIAAGRVEKERGNAEQALVYLEKAQAMESPLSIASARLANVAPTSNREYVGLLPIPDQRETRAVASTNRPLASPPVPPSPQQAPSLVDEINAIKLKLATTIDVSPRFLARSGEPGLGRLDAFEIPIEVSMPASASGVFTLRLTPTILGVGSLNRSDPGNIAKVGSAALGPLQSGFDPVANQDASGVALSVGYRDDDLTMRIGTTPLGFLISHVVGELTFASHLDDLTLKAALSRRAVTDSVLSSAGMRDPQTLQSWGGVVKTGVRFGLTYGGDEHGVYADLGAAQLSGKEVKDNTQFEVGVGAYWRIYQSASSKLKLGLNLTTMAFRDNLGFFTLGHGGYFSPQKYFSLGVPWEWTGRRGGLSYQLGGDFSLQNFSQDRVAYFPNDAAMQKAWTLKAGTTYPAYYEAESGSGLGYNLYGGFEYSLTPRFAFGGRLALENSRNYSQQTGTVYLRYAFDGFGRVAPF